MAGRRASPGIGRAGHNSGLPTINDIRSALAIETIFEEEEKKLREKKKRARKRIEAMGVRLDDLSFLKGMRDKAGSEVEEEFRRHWHLIGAIHEDKFEQLDIFAPKPSAPAVRAAHFTMGLLAGLQGKDLEVPPMVAGDERQQMIDGHNEGMARRQEAWSLVASSDGETPIDGTGKTPAAKTDVVDKAAQDFAEDQGADPLVVNGEKYKNMRQANAARARLAQEQPSEPQPSEPVAEPPESATEPDGDPRSEDEDPNPDVNDAAPVAEAVEAEVVAKPKAPVMRPDFHAWSEDWMEWSGAQQMEFRRWFESLPAGMIPPITHEGAVNYFNELRTEQENKASGGPDEPEEVAAAPAPQVAEIPDPKEVEAAARKLQESGFVPPKATRSRRKAS